MCTKKRGSEARRMVERAIKEGKKVLAEVREHHPEAAEQLQEPQPVLTPEKARDLQRFLSGMS